MAQYVRNSGNYSHIRISSDGLTRELEFDRVYNFPPVGHWRYIADGNKIGEI